jgi:heme/copper-type cytochrome/quinol oxidase subunit 2
MKKNIYEILVVIILLTILVGTPLAISHNSPWKNHSKTRMINITAVAAQGIFTEDVVNGFNYWNTKFKRANIVLVKGEKVIFRFTSVDVTHSFYAPEAGLGPIVIEAGHFYDIIYTPNITGKFTYYCTSVCGHCHNYMRGNFVILEKAEFNNPELVKQLAQDTIRPSCCINNSTKLAMTNSFVNNGKLLFNDKGCFTCHGVGGKGGVYNPNYALKYVPTLSTLANKLKISDKSEADSIIKYLERGDDLGKLNENPPFPSFNRFYAQYSSITQKIRDGAPIVQRLDTLGYNPPLCMPSWEHHLTTRQINSIISYLINNYDWENE